MRKQKQLPSRQPQTPLSRLSAFFATLPARTQKLLIGIGAALGAMLVIATTWNKLQKEFPDLHFGAAAENCANEEDYDNQLRAANLPLIRCYVEKKGRSPVDPLPAASKHYANHTPLMLVADLCEPLVVEYLLDHGADPRIGHQYDYASLDDLEKGKMSHPPNGRCLDIPRDIVEGRCPKSRDRDRLIKLLKQAEDRFEPRGPMAIRNNLCPWKTKKI
jgi:hypothetical protein